RIRCLSCLGVQLQLFAGVCLRMCCVVHFLLFFFFLMIRRPPRSTLFPTRRSSDLGSRELRELVEEQNAAVREARLAHRGVLLLRSEEHTSELQSQSNLVCRLLLEKKKKKQKPKDKYRQSK